MIQKVEAELARAQKKKESNLRQQSLDIKVLNRYIGEQGMNLSKETSYAKKSAEAALSRIDREWGRRIGEVKRELGVCREHTHQEEQCRNKSEIHLNETLRNTKAKKRSSLAACDADIKEIAGRITELNAKIKVCKGHLKNAELEREMINEFSSVYECEMEQARMESEFRMKTKWAAVKLQSAWRGVMVRKALGPYKYLKRKRTGRQGSKKKK
ncbi:dynein regulatory complex protein 9-like [Symsagittifera roscoffensis]|uniref:dynein regulatory complex protein 9-like n=1 Tax=Symsagittifera roscoffensis TaxID=84072 RepID=UPI00307B56B7